MEGLRSAKYAVKEELNLLFQQHFQVISFELYIVSRIILGFAVALGLGLSAMLFNESRLMFSQISGTL